MKVVAAISHCLSQKASRSGENFNTRSIREFYTRRSIDLSSISSCGSGLIHHSASKFLNLAGYIDQPGNWVPDHSFVFNVQANSELHSQSVVTSTDSKCLSMSISHTIQTGRNCQVPIQDCGGA